MLGGIAAAFPIAIALWLAIYFLMPPLAGMAAPLDRLAFALKCLSLATLFCLVTGIEAIAHERLVSPAIDPLAGYETHRMRVNQRYLQNTLEQFVVFAVGLLGLAVYCPDGGSMRAIVATTAVWVAARTAFWIGYHIGPLWRALGAPGVAQSLVVLLYVCARFGFEIAGIGGAAAVLALYAAVEAVLFRATREPRAGISSETAP